MTEVEDALSAEKYQLDLLQGLEEQLEISKINLIEARTQYEEGLSDYLDVIAATRSLEGVQQNIIRTKKSLLSNRAKLYLALGGPLSCAPEEPEEISL
jgi:multidrug efflux system outer membrane protein